MNLQELLGIDLPIIQAPVAGWQGSGALAPLRKKAESLGSGEFSPMWAGQNVSGCREISAADLTRSLAA